MSERAAAMAAAREATATEAELHRLLGAKRGLREVWLLMRRTTAIQATQRDRGSRPLGNADSVALDALLRELAWLCKSPAAVDSEAWHKEVGRVVCEVVAPKIDRENLLDAYVDGPSGLADAVRGAVDGS